MRAAPVAVVDVADGAVKMLTEWGEWVGKAVILTGPRAMSMAEHAGEDTREMGREVEYEDIPMEGLREELGMAGLPEHVFLHLATLARLLKEGEYDRCTDDVWDILGRLAASMAGTLKGFRNDGPVMADGE